MYDKEKYLNQYHNETENQYIVYIINIKDKNIWKIGKTNKLKYRLVNLKQSLYEEFEIYKTIRRDNNEDVLKLERYIKKKLQSYNIRGEWFNVDKEIIDKLIEDYDI
jgi:hypothetical protein